MTCGHCCGADQLFDLKSAQKEMKKYSRKGPGKSTRKLIDALFRSMDLHGKTLLDVGGGIGALQWSFLENGGASTKDVDASRGYLYVAGKYASEKNWSEKASFLFGDFVDRAKNLDSHDYVTLDKVICCYPDYRALLQTAMQKSNNSLGVVFPFGGIIPKALVLLNRIYFYIKKNPFRTYIHSPAEIEEFIKSQGFDLINKRVSFPWHVQVYQRSQ